MPEINYSFPNSISWNILALLWFDGSSRRFFNAKYMSKVSGLMDRKEKGKWSASLKISIDLHQIENENILSEPYCERSKSYKSLELQQLTATR